MVNINIAIIISIIGLVGWVIPGIVLTLLHKLKKLDSFVVFEENNEIIIKQSTPNIYLNSISNFFLLSIFGSIVLTTNLVKVDVSVQLIIIYSVCAILSLLEFSRRKNFKVVINKSKNSITFKTRTYSLDEYNQLAIADRRLISGANDWWSYSLYIKNNRNKYKRIYSFSIYKDLENLKLQIETRMNSR